MQPPPQKPAKINLSELKDRLVKKLGPERSNQYFDYLKRFLSLKLSKNEFDKACLRTIGRDNLTLHNELIRSILKNAFGNKVCHENGSIGVVHSKQQAESLGKGLLHAPLGIPGGARNASSFRKDSKCVGVYDTGDLIETIKLKERMEQLAATQGVNGVSMDCASMLNNRLNAYLKGLIRSFGDPVKVQMRNKIREREPKRLISLIDFNVAVENNPRQLGEDWPILLEKIHAHAV